MRSKKPSKERKSKTSPESEPSVKRPYLVPVFAFESYRSYLLGVIEANPMWRGLKKQLSEAAGCTQSFLAQVLSDSASFSFDHMHGIALFLGLSADEWGYLRELLVGERCATPATRKDSARRAEEIRGRYGAGVMASTPAVEFDLGRIKEMMFSLLHWDVFHVLGAPLESTPERLAARFKVPRERVMDVLKDWERMGLAGRIENGEWRCTALRFQSAPAVGHNVVAMHKIRQLARVFEGTAPPARFAAVRLRKAYLPRLEEMVDELFEEAWRLANLSEQDGDQPITLSVEVNPV